MRRILFIALAFAVLGVNAQDDVLKSKRGKVILPQAGDIGFGIEGTQFVNYVGNFFNEAGNNTMNLNLPNNGQTFCFKYVKDQQTFYRAKLRIGYQSVKDVEYVTEYDVNNVANPDLEETVEDEYIQKSTNIELRFGLEKRKGSNRLQGFYGAEFGVFYSQDKDTYEYGNDLEDNNTVTATYTTFYANNFRVHPTNNYNMRKTEENFGSSFGVAAGLFIGAEYFFAPKMSVAGEFGWDIVYNKAGESLATYEYWDPIRDNDYEYEEKGAGGSLLYIDNRPTGLLTLNLYF